MSGKRLVAVPTERCYCGRISEPHDLSDHNEASTSLGHGKPIPHHQEENE